MNKIWRFSTVFCMIILLFTITFAQTGFTHTYLHESNPSAGEVVTKGLSVIELNFETKIEALSTFELWRNDTEQVEIDQLTVEHDTMTGTFEEALISGVYTVKWNIIGADGHPITGDYTFTVDVPERETEVNQAPDQSEQSAKGDELNRSEQSEDSKTTDEVNESKNELETSNGGTSQPPSEDQNESPEDQNSKVNTGRMILPLALFVLAGVVTWLVLRRKRK